MPSYEPAETASSPHACSNSDSRLKTIWLDAYSNEKNANSLKIIFLPRGNAICPFGIVAPETSTRSFLHREVLRVCASDSGDRLFFV